YLNRSRTSADYTGTHEPATALREALTDGGVTFVKLGQMLATRPVLLPPRYIAELSRLDSQVPADPWESVKHTLTEELGDEPEKIFLSFNPIPLAAASLGQVHRATLPTGQDVVVKVQRASPQATVNSESANITRLARMMEQRTECALQLGRIDISQGYKASLYQ